MKGRIFNFQRYSIHDGPGIRSVVFLHGCPLRCVWCCNPESISDEAQLIFYGNICIGCRQCVAVCTNDAILSGDKRVNRAKCRVCGDCTRVCPSGALQMAGVITTVAEIVEVVMQDAHFYESSGGGVTLSGGEPFYQYDYTLSLLGAFKEKGLHTTLETCGLITEEKLDEVFVFTDLFLYDIKVIDADKHKKFCGIDNAVILDNARHLVQKGAKIIFRIPLIPGCNDTPDDIGQLGEFIISLPGEQELELMPYHRIGISKYESLGLEYHLSGIQTLPLDNLNKCRKELSAMGVKLVGGKKEGLRA